MTASTAQRWAFIRWLLLVLLFRHIAHLRHTLELILVLDYAFFVGESLFDQVLFVQFANLLVELEPLLLTHLF